MGTFLLYLCPGQLESQYRADGYFQPLALLFGLIHLLFFFDLWTSLFTISGPSAPNKTNP